MSFDDFDRESIAIRHAAQRERDFYERSANRVLDFGEHAAAGDPEWFQAQCCRTVADMNATGERLAGVQHLMHAAVGMATEAGELLDMLKKYVWYGKPFDQTNAIEELGDALWYVSEAATALDVTIREVMIRNAAKLRRRYSSGFSQAEALTRKLDAERAALEAIVGPVPVEGMTVSEVCRATQRQNCHMCEDCTCGDNTNPEVQKEATHG